MISGFVRTKRATDLLDDEARARIVGLDRCGSDVFSSGSEHSGQADDDFDASSSLSDPFFGFGVEEAGDETPEIGESDCERDPSICELNCVNVDLIERILLDEGDVFKKQVRDCVLRAVQVFSCLKSNEQIMRRNVMAYLRNCGWNAAICKTKWQSCGGLAAGEHEFIDVVRTEYSARYFIDLDFAAEFEIARPTNSYECLLQHLPRIFVGASDDLKQILKLASDSARRSLKSSGLHLPPWRKHRFMQNKWFGPYRRTTNLFPASFSSPSPEKTSYSFKCRVVGFPPAVDGDRLFFPAAA
ncbi:uncharacterized protein LOC127260057 [Andrographis paniculata]|uniref:uncharacterized protein LOC127260057 n=1 Tax=Andrographis paniculata TaxID=175694 RepID=UPI0021E92912|nr:uncharacterized protein LOC127260057 [Andrographis paniculata]